jgi:hypothetical protein
VVDAGELVRRGDFFVYFLVLPEGNRFWSIGLVDGGGELRRTPKALDLYLRSDHAFAPLMNYWARLKPKA